MTTSSVANKNYHYQVWLAHYAKTHLKLGASTRYSSERSQPYISTYKRRATETAEEEEARKASDRGKTARYRDNKRAESNDYAKKTAIQNKNFWTKNPNYEKEWRAKDKQKKLAQAAQQNGQTSLNAGWKTKTWRDKGVVDTRKESAEAPVLRTSMELTQRERQTEGATQPGTAVYLIVGYAKWDFQDAKYKKNRAGTKDPTGTIKPSDKEILPWMDEKHPTCYVVSEFFEKEPDQLHLLVLFIRKTASAHHIRLAQDILEPHEPFGKEITMLIATFEHTKSDWILQELEHLLKRAHMDLEYRPAPEYEGLVSFAEAELAEFTGEHAEMVVQEAAQL
ncbi:hypothetical protein LTR44_006152 [Exophiala sp. CCFEE 6388]|uniref:Uncharacterized protein n=1 Tax=Exophiala sideris TaxID=1016849 RepID=A0ABR0J5Q5_9EURO|nr:hypothetical protein LTR69_007588 [Exophiala sideris]KAK5181357.1 hypothetical protein LTR44_006152 [Eurotiomycetes sp. CCFEE 6388]